MTSKPTRYPFMTAWIGLIVLTCGAVFVLGLISSPVVMLATKASQASPDTIKDLIIPIFQFVIAFVAGFFIFKFVVRRHILGKVDESCKPVMKQSTETTEPPDARDVATRSAQDP